MTEKEQWPYSKEWLLERVKVEDESASFSVGGLAADIGWLQPAGVDATPVFARFVDLARRARGMSWETLARSADVELADLMGILEGHQPTPRTVYMLAHVLHVSNERLMELSGLAEPRQEVAEAAVRFAARSEPNVKLSAQEREALEEFVKVLVDRSDV